MTTSNTDSLLDTKNESQVFTTSTPPSPDATKSSSINPVVPTPSRISSSSLTQAPVDDPDQKLSRKREREVSLEPSTPKLDVEDNATKNYSGLSSPKKRNRIGLDTTEEEDVVSKSRTPSRSRSRSPARSRPSPPHEVKVRQISQGVEDISWRRNEPEPEPAAPEANDLATDLADDSVTPVVATSPAPSPPVESDAAEVSPDCSMENLPEPIHARRSSGSDGEDKGLKRKLADRAASHGPENGDVPKTLEEADTLKRSRDEDDNPRAKKRPTPPRTPEAASGQKQTPPATPPSDSDELPKPNEALKRPRDDEGKDDNPRQTKKPSPPPEKTLDKETATTTPKLGGFMAYASTSSPFASVKGQKIFGSSSKLASLSKVPSTSSLPPSPSTMKLPLSSPCATSLHTLGDPSHSAPTATKRTGFEAFSGSVSPFASVARAKSPTALGSNALRPKSPPRRALTTKAVSPFTSYASSGAQAFAVPMPKRARAGSPDGSSRSSLEKNSTLSVFGMQEDDDDDEEYNRKDEGQLSFGEKLRASKNTQEASDDDAKPELTAQKMHTGEEEEHSMYVVRAKLFRLSDQNQWKERGTGTLKLNVRISDGEGARLIMRKEAVFTVLLNVTLFYGMSVFVAQDPRYIRLSVIENGATVHYNLRVASAKIGEELMDAIKTYIPSAPA